MLLRQPVISILQNHLISYPTPANLTYFWGFGSLSGLFLVSQILTGVFLAMHYSPSVDLAFASLEHIMRDVNNGWFFRYLHANGASVFFFFVYIHIGRTLYFGFYQTSRKFLWISGIIIFFLMMAIAFMGYVLPWGQMSFWGATVITNLFTAIPLIGEQIAYWLWGGFSVSNATLTRFFSFHYCLPFILCGVVLLHLLLLHNEGSSNPLGIHQSDDKIAFYPYFYVKDYFGFMFFFSLSFFIISYYPDILGHPDNYIEANALVTPTHIVPEWYFLPFYAILRAVPNKLGGVLLMGLSIAILAILPFYKVRQRSLFLPGRFIYLFFFWLFAFCVVLLGYLGGLPIESPYTEASQIFSFYYFCFFAFFVYLDYIINDLLYTSNHENSVLFVGYFNAIKNNTHPRNLFYSWIVFTLQKHHTFYETLKNAYFKKAGMLYRTSGVQYATYKHPYHLVNVSPWPFFVSLSLFAVTMGSVMYLHNFTAGLSIIFIGISFLLFCMFCWFRDVIREGTFEGHHTILVQRGLKLGMLLFILSEVMFFFSFFWGFFHSSLSPAVQIGGIWPPLGVNVFNPWEIPLLNTLILLTSGASVTWAHYAIRSKFLRFLKPYDAFYFSASNKNSFLNLFSSRRRLFYVDLYKNKNLSNFAQSYNTVRQVINYFLSFSKRFVTFYRRKEFNTSFKNLAPINQNIYERWFSLSSIVQRSRHDFLLALMLTIILGIIFTIIQFYEYKHATFTISDSVYGSTFFLTTGFHGIHVIVGTLFLLVCFFRGFLYHFTRNHHVGLESAIWYWHFVDVVWLGLYVSIYHWGGAANFS